MRRTLAVLVAALAAAPAARAAGGPTYTAVGGTGVAGPHGLHYVAIAPVDGRTTLVTVGPDGSIWSWPSFDGAWGIPVIGYSTPVGVTHDGRRLFLQSVAVNAPTHFLVVDLRRMRVDDRFTLRGAFSFDALSPDGTRLYVTQRVDLANSLRYVVRAYDLRTHALIPGRIADRTQRSWVMEGEALTRTVSPGGRFVYTFYSNPNGTPFVHALDTVRGVAHCVGIPWSAVSDQSALANVRLSLPRGGGVDVGWRSGRPWLRIDTATWRVSPAGGGGGFPWPWLGLLAAVPLVLLLRRRPRGTLFPREA